MPVELYRIDDRLIHGQVVLGWGRPLDVQLIVVVDDELAASEWEQELYRMAVPPEMEVRFASVDDAARAHAALAAGRARAIVLAGDVTTMRRFVEAVRAADGPAAIPSVNVGGVHHRAGRVQRMRYVFLTQDEEVALRAVAASGVHVTAQDVPAAKPVPLHDVLAGRADA
ncbi:PTS sugar transporter subunit IIBC [Gemmatimonadetes bacterium T265]|nr:PTS sugar transporter subunit IIBC [Gemmatimonadetes bacterium T265]